jgi:ComF family protein
VGITEAVFSSSGDRIRAIQVQAAQAGTSIASATPKFTLTGLIGRFATSAAQCLFTVLFPSDCRLCGSLLPNVSRLPVCPACLAAIHPASGILCAICSERIVSGYAASVIHEDAAKCGLCRRIEPPFVRALAYGSFEGGLRELIHLLKYARVRPAANVLGRMLAEVITELQPEFSGDDIAVIPVPLYRGKQRQREFNQAELITRAALKLSGHPARLRFCPDLVERKRATQSQAGLTSHQRRENVRGAFGVTRTDAVKGREVLVIDDVYTTGATVSECARVLRRAGATKVWIATVARTMKIEQHHVQIENPEEMGEMDGEESLARAASG